MKMINSFLSLEALRLSTQRNRAKGKELDSRRYALNITKVACKLIKVMQKQYDLDKDILERALSYLMKLERYYYLNASTFFCCEGFPRMMRCCDFYRPLNYLLTQVNRANVRTKIVQCNWYGKDDDGEEDCSQAK